MRNFKVYIFFLITVFILFPGLMQIEAASVYDSGTNTITLGVGNNTLNSIYTDISDPLVLDYNGVDTYTIYANITGENGVDADLFMESSTLIFSTSTYIKTWSDLVISSMTIQAADPDYPWKIWSHARYTTFSVTILDSDISGGQILVYPNGYLQSQPPMQIKNNNFHDLTIESNYMVSLALSSPTDGYLYNNTFDNVQLVSGINYDGIIKLNGANGLVMDKFYISNCSTPSYGMIYFYGTNSYPATLSNFEIKNCSGYGITGKEWGNVIIKDGSITDMSSHAIHLYHSKGYGNTMFWIWNVDIDNASAGISENGADYITTDIYNVRINNVGTAFNKCLYGEDTGIFYITNSIATNYTKLYNVPSGEIKVYELADVYVIGECGTPINGAEVTVTINNNFDEEKFCINRGLQSVSKTTTGLNGHTPLPGEDSVKTLALLRFRKTNAFERGGYNYTVTAEKEGFSNSVIAVPNSSWYRPDPDTYQNTITIVLPIRIEDGVIAGKTIVFPNPYVKSESANNKIIFAVLPKETTIRIYTIAGKLIKTIKHLDTVDGGSEGWDISSVAGGIYMYTIISPEGKKTGKVSIVK